MPVLQERKKMWFDYPADPVNFTLFPDVPEGEPEPDVLKYKKDPYGGRIQIIHRTKAEQANVFDKINPIETCFDADSGKPTMKRTMNSAVDRQETATFFVSDWQNFFDGKKVKNHPHGKELPCTDRNKRRMSIEDGFMNVVNNCRLYLAKLVMEEEEKAEKNE